jgi:hypothetical protein
MIRREGTGGLELKVTEESGGELKRDEDIEWSNGMNKRKETCLEIMVRSRENEKEKERRGRRRKKMKGGRQAPSGVDSWLSC